MKDQKQDLTQGPLGRRIFRFSLPLIASNILQVLFNMADLAVVGRFAGPLALGAVGSTAILVTLFTVFLIGMGSGVNVLTARYIGSGADGDVEKTVHTSALLCALIGLLFLLAAQVFSRGLLALLNTKEELIGGATLYLRIYFLGMPAMAVYNFGQAVYSAAGETKKPLYFLFAAGLVNVALNLLFVVGLHLDVAGVAIASVLSQCLSAALVILSLAREKGSAPWALSFRRLRIDPGKARFVLSLGITAGAQSAVFSVANLFLQAGINSFDALTVAGNAAANNADALVYDVMAAFYAACASFMSQNLGTGKRRRALHSYFWTLGFSFLAGGALGVGLYVFGRPFLSLFTTDPAVVEAGMLKLAVMAFSYPFSAPMDDALAALRAMGKKAVPSVYMFLFVCVFRIAWIYTVFAHYHTIMSLYLLYIFSWALTGAAENLYLYRSWRRLPPEGTPLRP